MAARGWLTPISGSERKSGVIAWPSSWQSGIPHFGELGQSDRLALVMRVAAGETAPANARALAELRARLQIILALQRRDRGRHFGAIML